MSKILKVFAPVVGMYFGGPAGAALGASIAMSGASHGGGGRPAPAPAPAPASSGGFDIGDLTPLIAALAANRQQAPVIIPPPPMPPPPATSDQATSDRSQAALIAQRIMQRGGFGSTIMGGKHIASREQQDSGLLAKQTRNSKQKLGQG